VYPLPDLEGKSEEAFEEIKLELAEVITKNLSWVVPGFKHVKKMTSEAFNDLSHKSGSFVPKMVNLAFFHLNKLHSACCLFGL